MNPPPLLFPANRFARRNATALKLLFVAFLELLLAPLHMVEATLHEGLDRHDTISATIKQAWGKGHRLCGPILVVPFSHQTGHDEWTTLPDGRRFPAS